MRIMILHNRYQIGGGEDVTVETEKSPFGVKRTFCDVAGIQ